MSWLFLFVVVTAAVWVGTSLALRGHRPATGAKHRVSGVKP